MKRSTILTFLLLSGLVAGSVTAAPHPQPAYQLGPPAVDPAFAPKVVLGRSRLTYWPHLLASPAGAYSNTLQLVYLQDNQQLIYRQSTDGGLNWQPAEPFGGAPEWDGSAGNLATTIDQAGKLTACWYQLYGPTYPRIHCRSRSGEGSWQPELGVPGTGDQAHMKVGVPAGDADGNLHLLIGRGSVNMFYTATADGSEWNPQQNMPVTTTSRPNPTFLPTSLIALHGEGAMLAAWGDARGLDGQGGDSWQLMTAYARAAPGSKDSWQTYYFTDTDSAGNFTAGAGQYRPAMVEVAQGRVGMVFECRPSLGVADRDICYREWQAERAEAGIMGGWLTATITIAHTEPGITEAPAVAVDAATGQVYVCWQDQWSNLRITCSYSADGVNWHAPFLVDGGPFTRQKMVSIAVTRDAGGGKLHVAWADSQAEELAIFYTWRPLPDRYPEAAPTPPNP